MTEIRIPLIRDEATALPDSLSSLIWPPRLSRLRSWLSALLSSLGARGIFGSLGLRIVGMALVYLSTIIIARLLGTSGLGQYMYAIAWLNILVIPATAGLEGVLTRDLAANRAVGNWATTRGLMLFSHRFVLATTLLVGCLAALLVWWLTPTPASATVRVFWLSLLSLPFFALGRLRQSALQGLGHVVVGQVPESLIRPIVLILILAAGQVFLVQGIDAEFAMLAFATGSLAAFVLGSMLLARRLPLPLRAAQPEYAPRRWLGSAASMLLVGGMYLIHNQTDTLMLGWIVDADAVGLYSAANRGAGVLGFVVMAATSTFAPLFAAHKASEDRAALQSAVSQSCRWTCVLILPAGVMLILFSQPFLRMFGEAFLDAATAMHLLAAGYMLTAVFGPIAMLLIMTGHEKATGIAIAVTAGLNVLLNVGLIPTYGIAGAAFATSLSALAWNVSLYWLAAKRLGVHCLPRSRISRGRRGDDG